jgi:hypothetical protein
MVALTSPKSGGHSVGIVNSQTKATEFSNIVSCVLFGLCVMCNFCVVSCLVSLPTGEIPFSIKLDNNNNNNK